MHMPAMALGERLPLEYKSLGGGGAVVLMALVEKTLPLKDNICPSLGC